MESPRWQVNLKTNPFMTNPSETAASTLRRCRYVLKKELKESVLLADIFIERMLHRFAYYPPKPP